MPEKQDIIIIGAGAAGLMAAKELAAQYNITILEARHTPGGRTTTIYPDPNYHIETGAEFIHGPLPITLSLLQEAGLSYTPVKGKMYNAENGALIQEESFIEGWDELLEKMGAVDGNMTMQLFLDSHFPAHDELRSHITGFVQGFDLADLNKVSIKYLYDEWTKEQGTNYRIDAGYSALMTHLLISSGARLLTDKTVTHIQWQEGKVTVTTQDHQIYSGAKVLITVPISVLQSGSIHFSPAIDHYIAAANNIGWGSVIKFMLVFNESFWKEQAADIGFIFSEEAIPVWWTQSSEQPILTGWLGGPPASRYQNATEEELLVIALAALSNIFGREVHTQLAASYIYNWAHAPGVYGGYTYGVRGTEAAKALLSTPIKDTLYFAGEALYSGDSPGTVEAAFNNGKIISELILKKPS